MTRIHKDLKNMKSKIPSSPHIPLEGGRDHCLLKNLNGSKEIAQVLETVAPATHKTHHCIHPRLILCHLSGGRILLT